MFENIKNNFLQKNDELLYEYVMEEMEKEELIKGLWAKALAHSEGNNDKAKSLYIQYRVQALKNELNSLSINYSGLNKESLWNILQNRLTDEEKITFSTKKAQKKEEEKYGKIRGWLLFFAIFLIIGDLSYLSIFAAFTPDHKESMQALLQRASPLFSYMNFIVYLSFIGLFFNTLLTIAFFRKVNFTREIAIAFFVFNIFQAIVTTYLLFDLKNNISTEVFNAMFTPSEMIKELLRPFVIAIFSAIWIFYFIYSQRVKKTFTKNKDLTVMVFLSAIVPLVLVVSYSPDTVSIKNEVNKATSTSTKKTCEEGNIEECFTRGVMYENGNAFAQDYSKAVELYKKACDGGHVDGCSRLGVMYASGNGVIQDYFKVVEFYQKACDGGNFKDCSNLGVMYKKGLGAKQDYLRAIELFKKACDGVNAIGCYNLGAMYENGTGIKQDRKKAVELFKKACDGQINEGCEKNKILVRQGY